MEINTERVSPIRTTEALLFGTKMENLYNELATSVVGDAFQIVEKKGHCVIALDDGLPMAGFVEALFPKFMEVSGDIRDRIAFVALGEDLERQNASMFFTEAVLPAVNTLGAFRGDQFLLPVESAGDMPVFGMTLDQYFQMGGLVDIVVARLHAHGGLQLPGVLLEVPNEKDVLGYATISANAYHRDKNRDGSAMVLSGKTIWSAGRLYLCGLDTNSDQRAILDGLFYTKNTGRILVDRHGRATAIVSASNPEYWDDDPSFEFERLWRSVVNYHHGHA